MSESPYYIVKRTRRGWAVYGRSPGDPSVHCLTREEAERDAAEMNANRKAIKAVPHA